MRKLQKESANVAPEKLGRLRSRSSVPNNVTVSSVQILKTESMVCAPISDNERRNAFAAAVRARDDQKAYTVVQRHKVRSNGNDISLRVIYKKKSDESAKGRTVTWGHHDCDKGYLRGDTPSVSFENFAFFHSVEAEKLRDTGQMDVKSAYIQEKGFDRVVYVRPPREENANNKLWKLEEVA